MNNYFTFLVKSKPVKQDVSRTVILPPMVSVICQDFLKQPYLATLVGKERTTSSIFLGNALTTAPPVWPKWEREQKVVKLSVTFLLKPEDRERKIFFSHWRFSKKAHYNLTIFGNSLSYTKNVKILDI